MSLPFIWSVRLLHTRKNFPILNLEKAEISYFKSWKSRDSLNSSWKSRDSLNSSWKSRDHNYFSLEKAEITTILALKKQRFSLKKQRFSLKKQRFSIFHLEKAEILYFKSWKSRDSYSGKHPLIFIFVHVLGNFHCQSYKFTLRGAAVKTFFSDFYGYNNIHTYVLKKIWKEEAKNN